MKRNSIAEPLNSISTVTTASRYAAAMLLFLAGLLGISQPASAADGNFVNLSNRGLVGAGDDVRIVGFIIEDGARQVLIQAKGPELANDGISNALADPVLTVIQTHEGEPPRTPLDPPVELMVNDNWEDSQGQLVSDLWGGSPPLTAGSLSSAVFLTLEPGGYTARVEGKNGTVGVANVEVYRIASAGEESPDRETLTALYNSLDGANWVNGENWGSSAPLSLWQGVTTDDNGRVTGINLSRNQLSGPIPVELGDLSNLIYLYLHDNQLSGPIPAELGSLSNLNQLTLSHNDLSGPIPVELGNLSNLYWLNLNSNQLSGSIPAELGSLTNLENLYLQDNQLSGCIPEGLRDVTNNDLLALGLSYCGDGPGDTEVPASPTNVQYVRDGSTTVVSWDAIEAADYYKIYYDDIWSSNCRLLSSGSPTFCEELTTQVTGTQYTHNSPDDVRNYYWVVACNSGGCSDIDSANPADFVDTKPNSPTNVQYVRDGSTTVVSWDAIEAADYYKIYYDDFWSTGCDLLSSGSPIFCDELATQVTGTQYTHNSPDDVRNYYWVVACNSGGCSDIDSANPAANEGNSGNIVGNFHLHEGHGNSRGMAYANDRFYIFNWLDEMVYAYTMTGKRDPENDFDLTLGVGPLHRFAYANGRFYVFHVQGTGGKLFSYTETGQRDASNDLELHANNDRPIGVAYANGRFYVADLRDGKVYAYTSSGNRDATADFELDVANGHGRGIAHANGRFYVVDEIDGKVYGYTSSGDRDATADFALACDNVSPVGIAYAAAGFHVLDWIDSKIYTYDEIGGSTDLSVCFRAGSSPGNRSYPFGTAISPLTFPEARGGERPLTYSLSPEVPGLSFNATMRRLTGTPSRVGTYNMTYRAMDVDGDTDFLIFTIVVTEPEPDLVVESATVSDDTPDAGASFTLSATVRNAGSVDATATTLRYYRSSDSRISSADTEVGTDAVGALSSSGASAESISLASPSSPGTYFYGACVDSVLGESDTANNCSSAVAVTVSGRPPPPSDDYTPLNRWWVFPNGLVNFVALTIGPGNCVNVNGSNLNGVTYVVHSSKWQRRAGTASSWEEVTGTERQGRVCSYIPTTSGEYRMVGDITVGGTRGNYSSENTMTIN